MASLGMLLGGIACGYLSNRFGRRVGFLAGSACSIIGVGVEYAASTPGVLLAGKIINGLALGFFLTLSPVYTAEIVPPRLRPALTAAVNLIINAGQMTAIGIGNTRFSIMTPASYKVLFAAQWAFLVFLVGFAISMPESPWYLIRTGKFEQAANASKRLSATSDDIDAKLDTIKAEVALEQSLAASQSGASYMECLRGTNFRRTQIVCGMFITQQFTGIAFYAQAL